MSFDEPWSNEFELIVMTQDERWTARFKEVVEFILANKRRPSKYVPEERNSWNWLRHNQKMYNNGAMKPERKVMFEKLLALCEEYKRVNQYV